MNSCIPLELALNFCGNCHYCFADLNSPNRTANVPQIMNLITGFREKDTYAAKLLQQNYPVVMSNHVDVFSKSNAAIALPIIEVMAAQGIPIFFQTKAPPPAFTALDMVPPSVWYVTITTLNEDIRRRVEPGAPPPEDRLRFIEAAVAKGHRVMVGVNPCVQDWIEDPSALLAAVKQAGAESIIAQALHLSNRQIANMPDIGRAALGEKVLADARRPKTQKEWVTLVCDLAKQNELEIYNVGQSSYSNYFQPAKDLYPALFPTLQDFINYCFELGKQSNDPIYWEEYRDFFVPRLPEGVLPVRNHLGAAQYQHFWHEWEDKIPKYMTYAELLWWCWNIQDIVYSPVNASCFAWAAHIETDAAGEKLIVPYMDSNEAPILLFRPASTKNVYEEWEF